MVLCKEKFVPFENSVCGFEGRREITLVDFGAIGKLEASGTEWKRLT